MKKILQTTFFIVIASIIAYVLTDIDEVYMYILVFSLVFISASILHFFKLSKNSKKAWGIYVVAASIFLTLPFLKVLPPQWNLVPFVSVVYFWHYTLLVVGMYVFLGTILLWMLIWFGGFFPKNRFFRIVKSWGFVSVIMIAITITGYGLYHAQDIRIRHISVKINNLPSSWKGRTIAQITDLHLGVMQGEDFLKKVVKITNQEHPDLTLIVGDIFDDSAQNFPPKKLKGFMDEIGVLRSQFGTYAVEGNHDLATPFQNAFIPDTATPNITILKDGMVLVDGLQIVGFRYYDPLQKKINLGEILKKIPSFKQDLPAIIMNHMPVRIEQVANVASGLLLSGHSHRGQVFPVEIKPYFAYGKYEFGLQRLKNLFINTSSGVGTWGPPIRVGTNSEIVIIHLE